MSSRGQSVLGFDQSVATIIVFPLPLLRELIFVNTIFLLIPQIANSFLYTMQAYRYTCGFSVAVGNWVLHVMFHV